MKELRENRFKNLNNHLPISSQRSPFLNILHTSQLILHLKMVSFQNHRVSFQTVSFHNIKLYFQKVFISIYHKRWTRDIGYSKVRSHRSGKRNGSRIMRNLTKRLEYLYLIRKHRNRNRSEIEVAQDLSFFTPRGEEGES